MPLKHATRTGEDTFTHLLIKVVESGFVVSELIEEALGQVTDPQLIPEEREKTR